MISELLLISLLIGNYSSYELNLRDNINDNVLVYTDDFCDTFLTSNGTFLSYFKAIKDNDRSSENSTFYSPYIQNKYYEDGYSATYNTDPLIVGKSLILDPYGNNPNFKIAFGLDLSLFPHPLTIINTGLIINKSSGTLNSIYVYKANNIAYSNINGLASFTSSYISMSYVLNNSFNIDLTDEVVDCLENDDYNLNIILEGHENSSICNIYSTNNPWYNPILYVEYTLYGNAPLYSSLTNLTSSNCLGFVRKLNQIIDINYELYAALGNTHVSSSVMESTVLNVVANNFGPSFTRLLSSYDSPIASNERRIACRLKLGDRNRYNGNYHFVCQCSDGTWAAKCGFDGYIQNYLSVDAPETSSNIWLAGLNEYYNSTTLYFAYANY